MISIKGEGSPGPDAFQTALNVAGSDPETRLRMILGEAYQKYLELCRWTLDELRKDEPKAPGLIALAERFAGDPSLLRFPSAPAVSDTQNIILQQAVAILYSDPAEQREAEQAVIEHHPT